MKHSLTFLLTTLLAAVIVTPVRAAESEVDTDPNIRGPRDLALTCRDDMRNLAGRFGMIEYEQFELSNITAAWRYSEKHSGVTSPRC